MKITLAQYAELAEWADRITVAANRMLVRGGEKEKIVLRALIKEYEKRFDDLSFKSQQHIADVLKITEAMAKKNPIKPGGCCGEMRDAHNNMKIEQLIKPAMSDHAPDHAPARCINEDCKWEGFLGDCPTGWEQESWETKMYQVALCPECGEEVES